MVDSHALTAIAAAEFDRDRIGEKGQQILLGAMPEFLQRGYAGTSMERVAKAAGVSKQTLYSYFVDKDDLFVTLVKYLAAQQFQLVWSEPLVGAPDVVLPAVARRMLSKIGSEPQYFDFCRLVIAESGKRPELSQAFLANVAKPAIATLTSYLRDCPILNLADPEATARIFVGTIVHHVLMQDVLHGAAIAPFSADRLVEQLVTLVLGQQRPSS
ncbi:transcriptional regulator [Rubidibacter lacunae KORDI 51-2]|uniref:Transcriptional regulator n=1 Tax=Rubidibacter lacunae KORDI 51-2 TaxID=582515 RepID=U5DEI5_9CHRO|nr:TetR/AcrR family transcriptional regulator [Rubidibacter lacunae]ERN40026.1 transcriptional regulator [Rubidibacter lacunae KORDI 51-2]